MVKYNLEDDIDFYAELEKSLDLELEQKNNDENNNICLITNEQLNDNSIELICGHKFNYKPLWFELYNQKYNSSLYKEKSSIGYKEQIKCPYCRSLDPKLLPFYQDQNLKLAYGITSNDQKHKLSFLNNEFCYQYCIGSCDFINELGVKCDYSNVLFNEDLNKTYCCRHFNLIKNKFIKDKKLKEKEDLKLKKIQEKEQVKLLKIQIKEKDKEIKKLLKLNSNKNNNSNILLNNIEYENVIINNLPYFQEIENPNNIIANENFNPYTCVYRYKKGTKKGCQCDKDPINDNGYCKMHAK
jgi:hypothetical protein